MFLCLVLNFDLHILYDYVQEHSLSKVVLLFQDSEAFEGSLLADLVDILRYHRELPGQVSQS